MEETEKVEKIESVEEAMTSSNTFMRKVFTTSFFVSLALAATYYFVSPSHDKPFHIIVIMGAGAVTIPMFFCTMRLMLKGYYLSLRGWQTTNKLAKGYDQVKEEIQPLVDKADAILGKAIPIAENIDEIVVKAKAMSEDLEQIAHKVKNASETLNGHMDFQKILEKLEGAGKSLDSIAKAFVPSEGAPEITLPEFDPTKTEGRTLRRSR